MQVTFLCGNPPSFTLSFILRSFGTLLAENCRAGFLHQSVEMPRLHAPSRAFDRLHAL